MAENQKAEVKKTQNQKGRKCRKAEKQKGRFNERLSPIGSMTIRQNI